MEAGQDAGVAQAGQLGRMAGGQAVPAGLGELRPGLLPLLATAGVLGGLGCQAGARVDLPGGAAAGARRFQRKIWSWHGLPPPESRTHCLDSYASI
ncbi:hypothetical protein GCM10009827_041770 [Dactylosporangium maewongense]|uniref:Uncharacterized protein n=1 Tax=Dactylosporangium maewongense TaxID=634393 RepID=A0ABN2AKW4_9ACTN